MSEELRNQDPTPEEGGDNSEDKDLPANTDENEEEKESEQGLLCQPDGVIGLVAEDLQKVSRRMEKEKSIECNCPYCTNILFKNAVFKDEASFIMRCPHCSKMIKLVIRQKTEIIAEKLDQN